MKVSLNWLKQWVDVEDSPEAIADRLTMVGLESAGIESFGVGYEDIVIGKILRIKAHPNAEKLSLCDVTIGAAETLSIICGAENIYEGAVVPVALIGSTIPSGLKIRRSRIRGVLSEGMICSEEELGLDEHSTGIMLLSKDLPLGMPFFEATGLMDYIIDFEITPNRGDCLSVMGIAREVSAVYDLPLKPPRISLTETGQGIEELVDISIENKKDCLRYCARLVRDVTIGTSPLWLRERLFKLGFRPINNVVDITNYVLLELGQPLHAFDFDMLQDRKIIVRSALEDERFTTLDGKERELSFKDLLICDGEKPVAIAGVMGGLNSEVTEATKNVLIESAYFRPGAIRQTAKRMGLATEASYRFERGVDPGGLVRAADLAASLMGELASGKVVSGIVDVDYRGKAPEVIELRTEKVCSTLGLNLTDKEVGDTLQRLSMETEREDNGLLKVRIPSFRRDITRPIDLIEEVGRMIGFDRIPVTLPTCEMDTNPSSPLQQSERIARQFLVFHGYFETINYSFMDKKWLDYLMLPEGDSLRKVIHLRNPISEDMTVLRTFLIPSLIDVSRRNFNYKIQDIKIFEFRNVYYALDDRELPEEALHLAGLVMGRNSYSFSFEKHAFDFLDIKGDVEGLCNALNITSVQFVSPEVTKPFLHPGISADLVVSDIPVGYLGKLNPAVAESFKIDENVYCFELDFRKLISGMRREVRAKEISRYPPVSRDLAVVVDFQMPIGEIIKGIYAFQNKYLKRVELFDIYSGKEIPEGKKSVALRVTYQAMRKTLKDKEVDKIHRQLASFIIKEGNVQLR